jgi:hypothetical protein
MKRKGRKNIKPTMIIDILTLSGTGEDGASLDICPLLPGT